MAVRIDDVVRASHSFPPLPRCYSTCISSGSPSSFIVRETPHTPSLLPPHTFSDTSGRCWRRAGRPVSSPEYSPPQTNFASRMALGVQCALESVVPLGFELFRHRCRRSENIKPMKRPWIHVELGRHPCLYETLRVLDILVDKQIECADRNVRRRQVRQISGPRRRRIRRHVILTAIPAQV